MACSPEKSLEVKGLADHEELWFCDRCQNREAEGERRAAKRQVFCWRATTGKRGPRGADQKRSRVSSRHRRRQRTSQRSPSIHVRFHAPGLPSAVGSPRADRQTRVSPVQDSFRGLVVAIVSGSASRLVGERSLRVNV